MDNLVIFNKFQENLEILNIYLRDEKYLYSTKFNTNDILSTAIINLDKLNYKFTQNHFNQFIKLACYTNNNDNFITRILPNHSIQQDLIKMFFSKFMPTDSQIDILIQCYYDTNLLKIRNSVSYQWIDILEQRVELLDDTLDNTAVDLPADIKITVSDLRNKLNNFYKNDTYSPTKIVQTALNAIRQLRTVSKNDKEHLINIFKNNLIPDYRCMSLLLNTYGIENIEHIDILIEQMINQRCKITVQLYRNIFFFNRKSNKIKTLIIENIITNLDNAKEIILTSYTDHKLELYTSLMNKYRNNKQIMTNILHLLIESDSYYIEYYDILQEQFIEYCVVDEVCLEHSCKSYYFNLFDILLEEYNLVPNYNCLINSIKTAIMSLYSEYTHGLIYKKLVKILSYKIEPKRDLFILLVDNNKVSCRTYLESLVELLVLHGLKLDQELVNMAFRNKVKLKNLSRFNLQPDEKHKVNISHIYNTIVLDSKRRQFKSINYDSTESTIYAQFFKKNKLITFTQLRQELLEYIHKNKLYNKNKILLPIDLKKLLKIPYKSVDVSQLDNLVSLFYN